jgi:hypothetical protein
MFVLLLPQTPLRALRLGEINISRIPLRSIQATALFNNMAFSQIQRKVTGQ